MNLYGGALSGAGALIRNAGDCIAQAAASSRFKTGMELVCDELRESASQLAEATLKLKLAAEEANADKNEELAKLLGTCLFLSIGSLAVLVPAVPVEIIHSPAAIHL